MTTPSQPRLLVVDDEAQIRRLLRITLEPAGFDVREAETGQQGLTEAAAVQPEAIILDLGLPDLNGLEVVRRLREWSQVPVLVLTVRDRVEDKIAALGIRVKQWVTMHGIAINVDPQLSHFAGIVPCGVSDRRYGVTSLTDLGLTAKMADVDLALRREFETLFGRTANYSVGNIENGTSAQPSAISSSSPSR